MATPGEAVYCTLLTSDHYLPGAVVLAHSLRDNGTRAKIVALFTPETLKESTIRELQSVFDEIVPVQRLSNSTPANLLLMGRLDLVSTFTKIELWRQTQYSKIVYMDADVVALRAPDELLSLQEDFAAAPDIGWPDIFNSGVMVLRPNLQDYYALRTLAERGTSFDGGDQGLLNTYFKKWHRLSFTYNCTPSGNYQYMPAYRHFESTITLIHFIGQQKPWTQSRHAFASGTPYYQLLGRWWAEYDRHYRSMPASLLSAPSPISSQFQPPYNASTTPQKNIPFYTTTSAQSSIPVQDVHKVYQHQVHHHEPSRSREKTPTQIAEDLHVLRRSPVSAGFDDVSTAFAPVLAHPQPIHPPSATQEIRGHDHHHAPMEVPAEVRSVVPLYVHGEEQSAVYVTVPSTGTQNFTDLRAQFITEKAFAPYHRPFNDVPATTQFQAQSQKPPTPPPPPPQQPEERPFSPPKSEWDASREPPPRHSRPEALSLETQTYTMSEDTHLFRPPPSYPEAPKNMYYEVPSTKPEPQKLAPIFPWEARASKPTRVFAEEPPETSFVPSISDVIENEPRSEQPLQTEPRLPEQPQQPLSGITAISEYTTPDFVPAKSWETFARGNAWDEVPEINKYIDAIQQRSKKTTNGRGGKAGSTKRPQSLKLTDFPTEVDRPSLPVTPAPIRRSFWDCQEGQQQESSEFPIAEGVPNQCDWVGVTTDAFLQLLIAIYSYWKITEPARSTRGVTAAPVRTLQDDDYKSSGANRVVRRD
ncbi:glycogenin [Talaromyces stipitatus ATCC 10500]|uniref:glycogenin glucosyltransferase n=1 Tax=Talaromyces stipitatus (strain ATCC 10500 / CBS 375.48 / QM 6759 / NRRL 1006) TaxID=441959 RepID=B8M5W6_TALSN|nr:glycogenin [Talaromyces stipitatus ATCC 10500]EED20093.1 glycogenin [Talaromyces stipitatus ATCC 10500]